MADPAPAPGPSRGDSSPFLPASPSGLESLAIDFNRDHDPFRYLKGRTELVDALVRSTAVRVFDAGQLRGVSIAAVGGYGRSELFPYSDVDLLLLIPSEADLRPLADPLAEFVRILWDNGLRLGHSVRTLPECTRLREDNTELHISLLDVRYLCGSESLFGQLKSDLSRFFNEYSVRFRELLTGLARGRHRNGNDTVYHLEPNIKEAPGGLRDLHLLGWLHQLAPRQQIFGESLSELVGARRFLFALRCFLHLQTQRDNNLLSFELQDRVAETLVPNPIAPEEWMRSYYKHARAVYQATLRAMRSVPGSRSSFLRQMKEARSRLGRSEFGIQQEQVTLQEPGETLSSAQGLFRAFAFVATSGLQLSWDAQRSVRSTVLNHREAIRNQSPGWDEWKDLLGKPHAATALREMQGTGLLGCLIGEWNKIDSLVVRDFYHRYTVDEHTFVAVETIDNLVSGKNGTHARMDEILSSGLDYPVLKFAILLHDIGKGTKPGSHVEGSLEVCSAVLERLKAPPTVVEEVRFLIERHLELSLIMNGRDLEDPATARYLTGMVNTPERLKMLTLFTFADISAVNPTAMTPWRFEQLWRVYSLGAEQLSHDLVADRIHVDESWSHSAYPEEMDPFLEGLPTRYLRTHSRAEIERHFALKLQADQEGVAVEIELESGAYVMTVLAKDRPGLFSLVCGGLASFGMNIVKAEAFSNAAGLVVDVFRFVDPMRTLELNPSEVESLRWTIHGVLLRQLDVRDLLRRRRHVRIPSSGAQVQATVRFNHEASERATLIAFVGEDRPGLLYDLTSAVSARGCDIEVVMIDTEGHKAIDVFYVTKDGGKLNPQTESELQDDLVRAATGA